MPSGSILSAPVPAFLLLLLVFALLLFSLVALVSLHKMRQREQQWRQSILDVDTAFANAPLAMAILDKELRYLRVNSLLAEINGLPAEEHIGKNLHEVVPDLAPQAESVFRQVLVSGVPVEGFVFEGTTFSQPKIQRTWRESIYPIRAEGGLITGIAVVVQEITEERRLHDALLQTGASERRRATELETVMDAAPAAVFIAHDRDCLHVTANAEAIRMLRLRPSENPSVTAPGKRPFTVYANGGPIPSDQLPLQRAAATGAETWGAELDIHFEEGDIIHVLMNAIPLRDETGQVWGAAAAFTDVTVQQRATELLRSDARRKDVFLATLAHELRNPLAALHIGLELLKTTPSEATSAEQTREVMDRQITHVTCLVEDLLDVSRICSGKLELRKALVCIDTIVDLALGVSRHHVNAYGHHFQINLPPSTLFVHGDEVRLAQVIRNLLDNAAKYTPPGGMLQLDITSDEQHVIISVSDDGIGIEREMLPRIFGLFAQAESGRHLRNGGMGLGLPLAKHIVELHGGTLTVDSAGTGLGSTFTVRLPQHERNVKNHASSN